MSVRILRFVSHAAVYAIGTAVLLASVLVTVVRLVLPDIGIYRTEVEAWVSNYMGYPVAIRSLEASWQGWAPNLQLGDIDLLNQAGTETITHFKAASITVDPVATLLARRIVPRQLVISGFDLSVTRMEDGAIFIQGIDIGAGTGTPGGRRELADWLFRQERIRIVNVTVRWTDVLHGQDSILLGNVALTLRSDGRRLQVEGSTVLPPAYGKNMDFAFDATGDLLTSAWSGEFFLAARDINPDNWYRRYRPERVNIQGGSADIRLWSRWSAAQLASAQGQIVYRDFVTHVGDTRLRVDLLSGSFDVALSGRDRWQLGLHVRQLETENGPWPQSRFTLDAEPGVHSPLYVAAFDYLKLEDITPLLAALPRPDIAGAANWRELAARGELLRGTIAFGDRRLAYNVGFRGLDLTGVRGMPDVTSASGRVRGTLDHGRLEFGNDSLTLVMPGTGARQVPLIGLNGVLDWRRDASGWSVQTGALTLASPDLGAQVSGRVQGGADGLFVDVTARAGPADALVAVRHLPLRGDSRLRQWLDRAVVSGRMLSAELVMRGRLADFPFRAREGKFAAIVNAEDVTLDYSDKWPPIDNLSGEIEIDGPDLAVRVAGGRIFSAELGAASARIPDIRAAQKRLLVAGSAAGTMADLGHFIEQSPLLAADPVLARVRESLRGGDIDLALDLSLPLGGVGPPAVISGTLKLDGAELRTGQTLPPVRDIDGAISFSRASASGDGIRGTFFGQPVRLAVSGDRATPDEPPRVVISGEGDDAFIRARVDDFLPGMTARQPELFARMRGTTRWDATMTIADADGRLERRIAVRSDLVGLALDLPVPFGKDAGSVVPFELTRELDAPEPADIVVRYGEVLTAAFTPRTDTDRTPVIAVRFGATDAPPHSAQGVRIAGTLEDLPVADWWEVLREVRAAEARRPGLHTPLDIAADGHVRRLRLLGQQFHDVDITAARAGADWEFRLEGAEIDGRIAIPDGTDAARPLRVDLARLKIARGDGEDGRHSADPRLVPPLQVAIADLDFQGRALGAMTLRSSPVADGMRMDTVEFGKPGLSITGSGTWLRRGDADHSHFDIHVHADAIDDMLQTFGYNVAAVRKGETELEINAGWEGTPADFSWARLNGRLHMQVRKGQLLDIEPKAGRLFGLLSFQSLPRRLSLDFTDLFGKGMAFDKIEGTFEIADGNAYTNDLHLRGPSAEVAVAGRTGLAVQDYDQIVTVTPQVTGSLPVAGALFGPVGIGIGAVLYLAGEVLGSRSDSGGLGDLLRYQYTVTGSWEDPVIEKVDDGDKG
jgi:uncharacterized protein (TIGR02099 family)